MLRGDRLVQAAAIVYALSLAVLTVERVEPQSLNGRAAEYVDTALLATTLAVLLWNGRRLATRRERHFWGLIGLGWACWLTVELFYFAGLSLPFATDALYVSYYLLLALAIDLRPHVAPARSLTSLRRRLESVAALVAFFGVLIYFALVVEPPLGLSLSFVARETGRVPFLLLRLSLDLFLLTRLLYAAFTSTGRWPGLYRLLAGALLLLAVRDGIQLLQVAGMLEVEPFRLGFDLVICLPGFLVILAARLRLLPAPSEEEATSEIPILEDAREVSRTSLVAVYTLIVPIAHFLLYPLGLLEEESRVARDFYGLIYLLTVGSIAAAHQFLLDKERRQAVESLRHEIDERELTNRKLALRQAEAEQFNYAISHELQAPLVTIGGFVGLLEGALESGDYARMTRDLGRIRNATGHMRRVLQELLELSRVGWRIEPTDGLSMRSLAKEARDRLEAKNEPRKPRVVIESDMPAVRADAARMVDVLANLIDNAVKFTPLDRRPDIRIGCRTGQEAVFYVADNGRGIESHFRDKIFGLFDRLDPTVEGTGIGLALVKRIVEEHGGRIWVESAGIGHGSTFCFTLGEPKARA